MRFWLLLWFAIAPLGAAQAALRVFACEPEWAALTRELGGDQVDVFSATSARQDPHHVQARPALIAKMRRADLLVCTGAELEIGWLPLVLRSANNPTVEPGRPGYLEAADSVVLRDVPQRLDRAEGDVHARGNPHIQTDPRNIARVAVALSARLAQLDPVHADYYKARSQDFSARWQAAIQRWEASARPLAGKRAVVHHEEWIYLLSWLGMDRAGSLEPKPGLPPTPAHLAELQDELKRRPADMIIRSPINDPKPSQWLQDRVAMPAVVLPFTVGGDDRAQDLFGLFDVTIDRLLGALK